MTINDTGAIISGHGITRALISQRVALERWSKDDRLRLIVIRETLELTRAFFISQDGSSSIDC